MKMRIGKVISKLNWKTAARAIISAGLLAWLFFLIDWKDLAQVWRGLEPAWILAAIAAIVISMIISVRKWQLVLDAQNIRLSWNELWKAYWAGLFFNNFLPSSIGGDGLRIWWVGKVARDNSGAATSVIVERILATTGLALTGLVAAAFVNRLDNRIVISAIILFMILIVVSLGLLGLICLGLFPRWAEDRKGKIISFLRKMTAHGQKLKHQPSRLVRVGILSVAFQLAVVLVNYFIFRALQLTALTWWDLLYVIPVISVAAMLPLGINGYGLREGAYVALLGMYQVPASTALSASLLFVFLVSLCSLYGGISWLHCRIKGEFVDGKVQSSTNSL